MKIKLDSSRVACDLISVFDFYCYYSYYPNTCSTSNSALSVRLFRPHQYIVPRSKQKRSIAQLRTIGRVRIYRSTRDVRLDKYRACSAVYMLHLMLHGKLIRNALSKIIVIIYFFLQEKYVTYYIDVIISLLPFFFFFFFFVSLLSRTFEFGLRRVRFTREQQSYVIIEVRGEGKGRTKKRQPKKKKSPSFQFSVQKTFPGG